MLKLDLKYRLSVLKFGILFDTLFRIHLSKLHCVQTGSHVLYELEIQQRENKCNPWTQDIQYILKELDID